MFETFAADVKKGLEDLGVPVKSVSVAVAPRSVTGLIVSVQFADDIGIEGGCAHDASVAEVAAGFKSYYEAARSDADSGALK